MAKTIKPSNPIEEEVNRMITDEFDKRAKLICSPKYYKNQYLDYVFKNDGTQQCIIRDYSIMLNDGQEFSRNRSDQKHLALLLERLSMVSNENYISFLSNTRERLKKASKEKYQYLIIDAPGRIKSFKSSEAKIRTKILRDEVIKDHMILIPEMNWSIEEKKIARNYLANSLRLNAATCIGDTFGIRFILYSHNKITDEEYLTRFLFEYTDFVKDYFDSKGFSILGETDYITNPKENGYQSYHIRLSYGGISLEVQLRTLGMHERAESGEASFDEYKDTIIQKFLKDFLYEISGNRIKQNERTGLLKEQTLDPTMWAFIPSFEIPMTPDELIRFPNRKLLQTFCRESAEISQKPILLPPCFVRS